MKNKWKNLSIALIIAAVVTGLWVVSIYYNILIPFNETIESMESIGATGETLNLADDLTEPYSGFFVQTTVFLIVVFCITTLVSYIIIERLRKCKNKKVN